MEIDGPAALALSPRAVTALLMLLVLTLVLTPILLIPDPQCPDRSLLGKMVFLGCRFVEYETGIGWRQPAVDGTDASASLAADSADGFALRLLAKRLPGAEPFAAPEVVRALRLTSQQQAKFQDLLDANAEALREVDERWHKASRHDHTARRQQVLDAARQEALKILTDSQRAAWLKLAK